VGVTDRPWRKPAFAIRLAVGSQRGVPFLDIERSQFLEQFGADVRHNLIFDQLAIPGSRPGADIAGGFPMVNAGADKLGNDDLVRFDVFGLVDRRNQFGQFDLRLTLGPAERVKLCLSITRLFVTAGIELKPKRILTALLDMTLHDVCPVIFASPFSSLEGRIV
jgi:hypothetical protein